MMANLVAIEVGDGANFTTTAANNPENHVPRSPPSPPSPPSQRWYLEGRDRPHPGCRSRG